MTRHPEAIALPRAEAATLAELLRTLETVLDIEDVSIAYALDKHFGQPGTADILLTAAGLHAESLQTLLADTTTAGTAP